MRLAIFYIRMAVKNRERVLEFGGEDVLMDFLEDEDTSIYTVSLTSLLNLCMDSGLRLTVWSDFLFIFSR